MDETETFLSFPPSLVIIPKQDDHGTFQQKYFLCQWLGYNNRDWYYEMALKEVLLAYDESIQIVSTISTDRIEIESLETLFEDDTETTWSGSSTKKRVAPSDCRLCNEQKWEISSKHAHLWMERGLTQREKENKISPTTFSTIHFLAPSEILPLQSLRISINYSTSTEKQSDDTLLMACWKRQLAGKVIFKNDAMTCRLRLFNHPQETTSEPIYGVVESLTILPTQGRFSSPKQQSTRSRSPLQYCRILPSTRITIVAGKTPNETLSTNNFVQAPSPSAKLLAGALQSIQNGCHSIPRTFLLSGPPGTGKTFSVTWAIRECNKNSRNHSVQLCSLRGSELLQSNNPGHALQQEFQRMSAIVTTSVHNQNSPTSCVGLIFLDECDALVGTSGTESRDDASSTVASMQAYLLDRIAHEWTNLMVVGATNRVDSLPPLLRRRFDTELPMTPPTAQERANILETLISQQLPRKLQETDNVDDNATNNNDTAFPISKEELDRLAELCVGFVPADLAALVRQAWLLSIQDRSNGITMRHLEAARSSIGSSALRDATLAAIPPQTTWKDIAGDPGGAKTALRQAIEWPRTRAKQFQLLGLMPPRGILLYGPPGCAKTTLARAAAGASGVAFLSFSPAQVYASSYMGEAEAVIRRAFALARSAAPCILFLDEIDSIFDTGSNSTGGGRGSSAEARVLSTFLNEMDGVDIAGKDGVLVLGATNRLWTLDAALLRPGRLGDKIIYLPPPDEEARLAILQMQFASVSDEGKRGNDPWNWNELVGLSEGLTGAELVGACQEAKMHWMRDTLLDTSVRGDTMDPSNIHARMLKDYISNALHLTKPLLSDPSALEPFRVFAKGKQGTF
ncbi:ATPase family associated with various cellular activities AAA [Nitzschia inconspicua]|uniref:ATPase family associated with various cellular activities AAA n=1 Tax=Nitzschia inconspicua TaxID=303405 RepID=A0A9K3Q6Q2_9STRA|nr:ATPase family associated with various cellular activities AAA [Nitzschia inconspicua]